MFVSVCVCAFACACDDIFVFNHSQRHCHEVPANTDPQEPALQERWGAGVETQKNVRGKFGGWGRVPFNEPYAPLLSTIYDGA